MAQFSRSSAGNVRDIMHSLSDVGGVINATEFVGQSSGKALKGQTQKVQQAVLQKFRSGGYNVIVATSIGEEGLDIMEVDLVICFDANISPLRMIQRMGRTGRKHDGRVVVLACEGSEVKGYLKKQANGKIVGKHMHNGGIKSFDFHPSPRMVPHTCRPQVQFVELSIKQFVPRGKKIGDVLTSRSPVSKKISEEEKGVISRYFNSSEGGAWKPSLIAFPRFQAFTSRVYRVSHSYRTTSMLIDAMQRLQGFSFNDKENHSCEMNVHEEIQTHEDNHGKADDLEFEGSEKASSEEREKYDLPPRDNSSLHSFLFNKDFVTVGTRGCVSISSVPVLSFINGSPCIQELENIDSKARSLHEGHGTSLQMPTFLDSPMRKSTSDPPDMEFSPPLACFIEKCSPIKKSMPDLPDMEFSPLLTHFVDLPNMRFSPQMTQFIEDHLPIKKSTPNLPDLEFSPRLTHIIEKGSPMRKSTFVDLPEMDLSPQMTKFIEKGSPLRKSTPDLHGMEFSPQLTRFFEKGTPMRKSTLDLSEMEFSPRLTHFIEKGIVPESPTVNNNSYHPVPEETLEKISPALGNTELPPGSPFPSKIEIERGEKTPVATHSKNSSSEGWQLGSADGLKSVHQTPKFKRLRRHRDFVRKLPCKVLEENFHSQVKQFCQRISKKKPELAKWDKGKAKTKVNSRHFIEEEAEVSSDARGSDDEDEGSDESQYDDSFIDDGIDSAETNTRTGNSGIDMMAFYRRSLLTQSPAAMRSPLFPANSASESFSPGSCSLEKIANSLHAPRTTDNCRNGSPLLNSRALNLHENDETSRTMGEIRKEKLSFSLIDLETGQGQTSSDALTTVVLSDDEFYEGLDLDAVEAQAAKLLRTKMPVGLNSRVDQCPDEDFAASPSFDLGI